MYVPGSFVVTDEALIREVIECHAFATLISVSDGRPELTRLPMLADSGSEMPRRLFGHLARANSQWQGLDGQAATALFDGPHAYVSASWYETEDSVPTWNYVSVEVQGNVRIIDAPLELLDELRRLVERFEKNREPKWDIASVSPSKLSGLLKGIVGIELEVERVIGKWKLGQNHPRSQREKTIKGLMREGYSEANAVANWMQRMLDRETPPASCSWDSTL